MITKEIAINMVQAYLDVENQKPRFDWVKYYHHPIKKLLSKLYPEDGFITKFSFFLDRWIKPDEEKWEALSFNENWQLVIDFKWIKDIDEGWWIPYGAKGEVIGKDDRYLLYDIAPIIVDKQSGNMYFTGTSFPQDLIDDFKLYRQGQKSKYNWPNHVINLQNFG